MILSSDVDAEETRFQGKPVVRAALSEAIKQGGGLIEQALAQEPVPADEKRGQAAPTAEGTEKRTGPYKHLMNGVSFMIPLVVAGGTDHRPLLHLRDQRRRAGRILGGQPDADRCGKRLRSDGAYIGRIYRLFDRR